MFLQAQTDERREVEARGRGGFSVHRWLEAYTFIWRSIADEWGSQVEVQLAETKALTEDPSTFADLTQFIVQKATAVVEVSEAEWTAVGAGLWDPGRATTMAATETVQATGWAQHVVAQQSKLILYKIWVSIVDDRTRQTHLDANGQRRLLNDPFTVGGAELQWPADAGGPLAEIINCRCWEDYELAHPGVR